MSVMHEDSKDVNLAHMKGHCTRIGRRGQDLSG